MTYPLVSESEFPQPPLIGTVADVAVTTSLEIARYFGKRHDNVLRDISNLQLSDFFRDLNYQASQYTPEGQTRSYPMYYITKDGFSLLAMMCFHEPDALQRKEVFINAFNSVEAWLRASAEEKDAHLPKISQVSIVNGKVVTTSLAIAEHFDKQHSHVLRDIRELELSDSFRQSNFGQSYYLNQQGKQQPMYHITRDGFIFLVMGFTGKEAARIKEAYIHAFNRMEEELRKPTVSSIETEAEPSIWLKKYVVLQEKYSELQEKYIVLQEKLLVHELKNAASEPPKPLRRRRLTQETIRQILELYQQGYSQTEIARIVGYSTATISVVVRQHRSH